MAYKQKTWSPFDKKCGCWKGYSRVPGKKPCTKGSCKKNKSKQLWDFK